MFNNYKRLPTRLYRQYHQHAIRILVAVILALVLYTLVEQLVHHEDRHVQGNLKDIRPEDVAIIILGGGLLADGSLPPHTMLIVERAVQLFRDTYHQRATIITLSGGTPHKPNPLDKYGFPVWEASAAAKKLIELGVSSEKVYEENFSLDTVGNAYFLRSVHMIPGTYRKMVVITNRWHMPRTQAIFERVFSLPLRSASSMLGHSHHSVTSSFRGWFTWCKESDVFENDNSLQLEFEPVGDGIEDAEVLTGRNTREKASLDSFVTTVSPQWHSFTQLHNWIFTKHQAYASERLVKSKTVEMDPAVLKSY